jgi:hypothetical protein
MPEEPTATSEPSPTPEEPMPTATMEQVAATPGSDPAPTAVSLPTALPDELPDLSAVADLLGVSEAELLQAINDPSANLSAVAEALGVDELALRIALEAAGVSLPE